MSIYILFSIECNKKKNSIQDEDSCSETSLSIFNLEAWFNLEARLLWSSKTALC